MDPKKGLPAICGAAFRAGTTRACVNVLGLQLVILDVDNAEEFQTGDFHPSGRPIIQKRPMAVLAQLDALCDQLERFQVASYAWTTWSSSPGWPRFRVVIPLEVAVPPGVWSRLGEWAISVSGLSRWRDCIDLPVLHDTARLNFLPAQKPGGPLVQRRQVRGQILVPPTIEALNRVAVPRPPLATWQKETLERRQVDGKHGWAKRFRGGDGRPLKLAQVDGVRLLESLGCRVGPDRPTSGGQRRRTTCPWPAEHTHGLDDDCAVLFMEAGRWPIWHCSHSHHLHLGLEDLIEAAGGLR